MLEGTCNLNLNVHFDMHVSFAPIYHIWWKIDEHFFSFVTMGI